MSNSAEARGRGAPMQDKDVGFRDPLKVSRGGSGWNRTFKEASAVQKGRRAQGWGTPLEEGPRVSKRFLQVSL